MSFVFQDTFNNTGGSNVDIDTWKSVEMGSVTPDWAYLNPPSAPSANAIVVSKTLQQLINAAGASNHLASNPALLLHDFNVAYPINTALTGVNNYIVTAVINVRVAGPENLPYLHLMARRQVGTYDSYDIWMTPSFNAGLGNNYISFFLVKATLYDFTNEIDTDQVLLYGSPENPGPCTVTLQVVGNQITWGASTDLGGSFSRTITDNSFPTGGAAVGFESWISHDGVPAESQGSILSITIENLDYDPASGGISATSGRQQNPGISTPLSNAQDPKKDVRRSLRDVHHEMDAGWMFQNLGVKAIESIGNSRDVTIENNKFISPANGDASISLPGVTRSLVRRNKFWLVSGTLAKTISCGQGSSQAQIAQNVISSGEGTITVGIDGTGVEATRGALIRDNRFSSTVSVPVDNFTAGKAELSEDYDSGVGAADGGALITGIT